MVRLTNGVRLTNFKDRAGNDNADVTPATGTKDSSRPTMEITFTGRPTNNRHIRSKRGHFWFYHRRCDCSRRITELPITRLSQQPRLTCKRLRSKMVTTTPTSRQPQARKDIRANNGDHVDGDQVTTSVLLRMEDIDIDDVIAVKTTAVMMSWYRTGWKPKR